MIKPDSLEGRGKWCVCLCMCVRNRNKMKTSVILERLKVWSSLLENQNKLLMRMHFGLFTWYVAVFCVCLCVCACCRQVVKWILEEACVWRLVITMSAVFIWSALGVCVCVQLLNVRQCVCPNMLKERWKTNTPTHLFMWVIVCMCVSVWVVWVLLPLETLQTGACLTGSQISVYSCPQICLCWFFSHTKATDLQIARKSFLPPFCCRHTL